MIATGRPAPILAPPSTEEEWEKCLTAILIEGQTIVCIDNVIDRLASAKLDAALTSELFQGRVLGQSATAQVPNRATWMATGNNIQLGKDLPRRSYWIRLDPKVSRPWMRTGFRHPNLVKWVRAKRMELVRALLILIRVWYAGGQPLASGLPAMATFSSWVDTIGSILAYIGVPGFLGNQLQHYEASDPTSTQWETFLQAWHDKLGSNWVKTVDIVKLMNEQATGQSLSQEQTTIDLAESLPERLQMVFKEKPNSFKVRLGQELKRRVDECFGENNLHVECQRDTHTKGTLWRVAAEVAGVAEDSLASSHREKQLQEKTIQKYTIETGRQVLPQPPQPPQVAEQKTLQTSLGSGSMPIDDVRGNANESPARAVGSGMNNGRDGESGPNGNNGRDGESGPNGNNGRDKSGPYHSRNELPQIAPSNGYTSNVEGNKHIASSEVCGSDDEEWEEFTI